MQGKTINNDFVNDFIIQCAEDNKTSPQEVCREARQQLLNINQELINLNKLKETKNSLLDVLAVFGDNKPSKKRDRALLPFFQIKMKHLAYAFCIQIMSQSIKVEDVSESLRNIIDELEELEIVYVVGGYVAQGRFFDLFLLHFMKKYYGL